ncbi:MAG: LysM peptidoglycan-binding domain-containing protein [Thermoguttaceae bacterium]
MDQRLRLMTAAAVMLVGLGLALLFRRPSAESELPIPVQSDPLVLRKQPDPRTFAVGESSAAASQPHPLPAAPLEPRRLSPTIITPADQPAPPPELPKTYPNSVQPASTRWGNSLSEMLPEAASAPPTHKVIDGDSLGLLAERYLGSASRAMEIYEANRNVLARPEILPIGAELKIPRADQAANAAK